MNPMSCAGRASSMSPSDGDDRTKRATGRDRKRPRVGTVATGVNALRTAERAGVSNDAQPDAGSAVARFSDWRERVASARVLIVGDVMLDRYWFGDVERISPEAPVPVVKIARSEERPGGAANVARNVAAPGAQALLPSATGRDEPAEA